MAIVINVVGSYNDRDIKRAQTDLNKLGGVAQAQSKSIVDSMNSLGKGVEKVGAKLTTHLTLPIIGVGAVSIKMASDVDKSLREVNTLLGETGAVGEANFEQLQDGVAALSAEVGIAQLALTEGLYQAISAGVPTPNAFTFMEVAAKASIAGVTDVNTAVDGLTTVINAFGMDTSEAQVVADSMFAAVKGGKTTFEELSASLFQIAPAAASANVSMQEVNAGIATLTASGVPTSVATTQMRAALVGLQRPSEAMTKIFNDLGFENAQMAIEAKGLGFALDAVKAATNGNNGELQTLLGSTEAVAAANVLAGTGAEKFAEELARQGAAAGSVDVAFEEMNKSTARQLEEFKVSLGNLGIEIGNILLPVLERLIENVTPIIDKFKNFDDSTKTLILTIAGVVAAVGPLLLVGGKLIMVVAGVTKVVSGLSLAMLANPVGLIVAAVAALIALLVVAYFKFDGFRKIVDQGWQDIQKAAVSAWEGFLKPILEQLVTAFKEDILPALQDLAAAFMEAWPGISSAISQAWGFIGPILAKIIEIYIFLYSIILPAFIKYYTFVFTAVVEVLLFAWSIIEPILQLIGFVFVNVIVPAAEKLLLVSKIVWSGIVAAVSAAWEFLKGAFEGIKSAFQTVVDNFEMAKSLIGAVFAGLADVITAPFRLAFNTIGSLWNSTIGGFGVDIPDIIGVPGRGTRISFPKFPVLNKGGVVPGIAGQPVMAMLHAGERVLRPSEVGGRNDTSGGATYNITINGMVGKDKQDILNFLARELPKASATHSRSFG